MPLWQHDTLRHRCTEARQLSRRDGSPAAARHLGPRNCIHYSHTCWCMPLARLILRATLVRGCRGTGPGGGGPPPQVLSAWGPCWHALLGSGGPCPACALPQVFGAPWQLTTCLCCGPKARKHAPPGRRKHALAPPSVARSY